MKRGLGALTVLVGFMVLALCGPAQATIFTVSDITFSDLSDTAGLKWTITPVTSPFVIGGGDLAAGGSAIPFTFGTIKFEGFAVDLDEFTVSLHIAPPGSPLSDNGEIAATASANGKKTEVIIDYVNTNGTIVPFGYNNTGQYKVTFNDIGKTDYAAGLSFALTADFHYSKAPDEAPITPAAAPVPEPGTVVLLGSGLLGLICVGRRRIRK